MFKRQDGQSSVELLVSAAVIVPIVLLIPTLANLLLAQTETHKAGRYMAWERVAYPQGNLKEQAELVGEVENRFFRFGRSGFSGEPNVAEETHWRDWGSRDSVNGDTDAGVVDYLSGVGVDVSSSSSATKGYRNVSSYLANRGGDNPIQLNTLQSGGVSIGVRADSSLLASTLTSPPIDPITGEPRYFLRSSSALVVDSWVPANDQVFHDRVGDIGGGLRNVASWYTPLTQALRPIYRELDEHMYVNTPGADSPFDMVDPEQSLRLPAYLKQ